PQPRVARPTQKDLIRSICGHRLVLAFPISFRIARDARRILPIPTRDTGRIAAQPAGRDHAFERQVTKRVGFDETANLLDRHIRRDQLRLVWRVDTVVTRTDRRWTTDPHVNLFRAR